MTRRLHENIINVEQARTLDGLFVQRERRAPDGLAYQAWSRDQEKWIQYTWNEMATEIARWQAALAKLELSPGDRVGILLRNCPEWVMFDQAALSLGLVVVPFYTDDRPENAAYILYDADVKALLVQDAGRWKKLVPELYEDSDLRCVILLDSSEKAERFERNDERVYRASEWLPKKANLIVRQKPDGEDLATIVYTSGTTGRPKGVMLSHKNILSVAHAALTMIDCYEEDCFLSFLPLSHTLERTGGYYLPMMAGASVAYSRSVAQLANDLGKIKPTVLIAVPRIFEKIYGRIIDGLADQSVIKKKLFYLAVNVGWKRFQVQQGRGKWSTQLLLWPLLENLVADKLTEKLGGNMRVALCGGAPLSPEVAKVFIGLGVPLIQGYGLTETSPVISVNTLENNMPESVGLPVPCVEVKIGDNNELMAKGDGVMIGYWNHHTATAKIIDKDGWLHTGDQGRIENEHIIITGRIKDILVLSNGEKIPPADMENAIVLDPYIEQVLVVGEGKPYLTALVVLDSQNWQELAQSLGLDPIRYEVLHFEKVNKYILKRIREALATFPGYAKIRKIHLLLDPWTIEDGLVTPTLKLKRSRILEQFQDEIAAMY